MIKVEKIIPYKDMPNPMFDILLEEPDEYFWAILSDGNMVGQRRGSAEWMSVGDIVSDDRE